MQRAPIADAQPCAAPEKVRVGPGGPVAVVTGRGETTLRPPDFCRIDPGQRGAIVNRPALPASMPVVVPLAGREGGMKRNGAGQRPFRPEHPAAMVEEMR